MLAGRNIAQIPREVPHSDSNKPIDIENSVDIILYTIIPILLVLMYYVVKKYKKNKE
jgi:hypothetical protein